MKNSNIILIEEQEKEDARALTQSFARNDVKSRAYINALGAEVCKKYFEKENISSERTYNLHNIRKILEEFDISDIKLSNIHIDVRVIFDENQIFIPKAHFEYNLLPDIYVVLKLEKEHKNTEFLGFFEPKLINQKNANSDYYFIEKEKLSSPVDLKNFVENFNGRSSKSYTEEEMHNAEVLMISMADNNVTEADKRMLLDYLINSEELRDEFIEFENFEMLSYQAASTVGLELPVKTEEMDVAQIPAEELSEDIAEEMIAEQSLNVEDNLNHETEDDTSGNIADGLIGGTAVIGAEIAGSAMVSAALAGTDEVIDSTANIINAAANVANITSEAIDMASSIQNMAEQVFADENLLEAEVSDMSNIADEEQFSMDELNLPEEQLAIDENINTEDLTTEMSVEDMNIQDIIDTTDEPGIEDVQEAEPVAESIANIELPSVDEGIQEDSCETDDNQSDIVTDSLNIDEFDNMTEEVNQTLDNDNTTGSLDDLFGDLGDLDNSSDDIFGENQNEFEFQNSSSESDDLVFENYNGDDEITFSNNDDYGDYVEYGDSSDPYAAASSSAARQQSLPQAHGVHTPISEATELMSLEDIKNGNIPPQTPAPVSEPAGSQMETMEMDEFHSLVDSYVPTEIKNESETVGFDSIANQQIGQAETLKQSETPETETASSDMQTENSAKNETSTLHESDAFVEEMPEINNSNINWDNNTEPTSDDFVEEMPDEIEALASGIKLDELTSDDFMEEMPAIDETASNWGDMNEPTSDDFVEQMPDAIEDDTTRQKFDAEPTSDDFVEEMPSEVQSESPMKEELTSDDFVEDIEAVQASNQTEENAPVAGDTISEITEEVNEDSQLTDNDMSILDELDKLDSLGLGELETEYVSDSLETQNEIGSQNEQEIEINEEEQSTAYGLEESDSSLGVLYNENNSPELNDIEIEQPAAVNYDFRPEKRSSKLMPLFAIVAAVVLVGAILGFLVKSKNSIDAETLIQAAPENEILATPEADNSDILANTVDAIPDIPQDATDSSAPAPAPANNTPAPEQKTPSVQQAEKNSAAATAAPKPLNGSKTVTVKKVSWEVPDYLSYSENIKTYLQTAGKSIKLTLSSDLLLTSEYIYSNQVKVDLKLSKDGNIQSSKIIKSSGSEEIDKIVLRTVNETLNVVKPAPGEVPTPNYNLAIIIYL